MEKDNTICFQTTSEITNALEKIAEEERLSISSVVESIVHKYLKDNKEFKGISMEQRRFKRKQVNLPAFIGAAEWYRQDFKECTILDISLGGIKFSVPKGMEPGIQRDINDTGLNVIFTLPGNLWAISVKFRPQRIYESAEEIQICAELVSPDYHAYTALQEYLN